MKYFEYIDNEENKETIIYYELDEEYYCLRAIFEEDNKSMTTNFIHNDYLLPEGSFYQIINILEKEIDENTFNNKWKIALKPFLEKWNETKNVYDIGKNIKVKINCIYPQGIIFDVNGMFYGIANYEECKIKHGTKKLYPKYEFEMKIIEYDEKNMWIRLKPI
jgi:hypothetical protein